MRWRSQLSCDRDRVLEANKIFIITIREHQKSSNLMTPTLPGYQIGSKIYEGERTLVYQGTRLSDSLNVVIKLLRNSYPSFSELVQFRNQYAISKNLNSTGIVVPLSLERYGSGYALVMPEEGAISLDKAVAKEESLDLGNYLD
ncbi:hypothetical protein PN466_01275, partial [Roseofilum reptotaenium CS-1145]